MTNWNEHEDAISDAISDSIDMDWTSRTGAKAVVAWLNENAAAPAPSSLAGGEDMQKRVERIVFEDFYGSSVAGSKQRLANALIRESILAALSPEAPARDGVDVLVQNAVAASMAEDQQWTEMSAPARAVLMIQICRRVTAALTPRHEAPAEGAGEIEHVAKWHEDRAAFLTSKAADDEWSETEAQMHRDMAASLRARSSAPEAREGDQP